MRILRAATPLALSALVMLLAAGCGGSTGGSGETGGRVATSPGVSGTARGALIDIDRNIRFAFADMEIQPAGEDRSSPERWVIQGRKQNLNITVTLVSQSPAVTVVEVRVRATETEYDNEFGQELLNKIIGG